MQYKFHYFYLYLRDHIESNHPIMCERADDEILTVSTWEKIRGMIQKAEVIIANCTGRNPNVFYELGMAHAFDKKVILVTSDPIESTPTDIRHLDLIKYNHSNHTQFLERLDGALENVLKTRYQKRFDEATEYFRQFVEVCPEAKSVSLEEFMVRYKAAELAGETMLPVKLLALVVENTGDFAVMEKLVGFELERKRSRPEDGPYWEA